MLSLYESQNCCVTVHAIIRIGTGQCSVILSVYKQCGEVYKKKNQSHYRPEVPRGFQEVKVPRLRDNGTGWQWGCPPYGTAAFTLRKYSWYSFLLESESTPGPQCDRKDYVNEKLQCHHLEWNQRPSDLQNSTSTTVPPRSPEFYKLPVTIFRWSAASRPFQPRNRLYTLPGEG